MWEIIGTTLLGAVAAAANSAVVYMSKQEPKLFDPVKFSRSVGVAALVAAATTLNPSLTAAASTVIAVYGGYLIEKLALLVYRKLTAQQGKVEISIKSKK